MKPVIITDKQRALSSIGLVKVPISEYYHGVLKKYGLNNISNGSIKINYNEKEEFHELTPYVDSKGWTG